MKSFNILLTCSSNKTQIIDWTKQSIKKLNCRVKIYGGDINPKVSSKYFCDVFWKMPIIKSKNYNKILKYCKKNNIKIIIPSSDKELFFWSTFKEKFKNQKIYVMVSEKETIKKCLDKLLFFRTLSVFKSVIFTSQKINDFKKNIRLVAKKRYGYGTSDIIINKNFREIKNNIKHKRDKYIFQKYISSGKEISIDCFFSSKNNKLINLVPRSRDFVQSGESVVTTVISKKIFLKEIKKIGEKFNFSGHIMFQCYLKNKRIYIFECNPRIGGASYMSFFNSMDSIYYFIVENIYPNKALKTKKNILVGSKLLIYKKVKLLE